MPATRSDLADLTYFLAVARHRNYRRAGLELGVTGSALSHAMKSLEERLGVRLLDRTTRSVTLTDAGEQLRESITDPIAALGEAVESLKRFRDQPAGRIRLYVPSDAAVHLLAPVLPEFSERYPDIEVEIATSNRMMDVIDGGFDAGIRFGGTVPEDMVAQRLSADIRWMVVGSPAYLEKHGRPRQVDDLSRHRCIRVRDGTGELYDWEFKHDGAEVEVAVPGTIVVDETRFAMALVEQGAGIGYGPEPAMREGLASGTLIPVLEEWATHGPGYFLYYSSRRQLPTGLGLLIDLVREIKPLGY